MEQRTRRKRIRSTLNLDPNTGEPLTPKRKKKREKRKKFYTVWEGYETGVFETWEECKKYTAGYPGAIFKAFPTLELAQEALFSDYEDFKGKQYFKQELSTEELLLIGEPIHDSISVDASFSSKTRQMEYRGVETESKLELFKIGPFQDSNNNVGEFLALVHALALMKQKQDTRPIYSDSKTAISWVKKKKIRSKLERNQQNEKVFQLVDRAITWLNTNEYKNQLLKWETKAWGEIPADFNRK